MNSQAQLSAAQQLAQSNAAAPPQKSAAADNDDEAPALQEADENGEVDETGLDPKEIELVMQQVNCSRAKAVRVLRDNGGDIINASECLLSLPLIRSLKSRLFSHGRIRLISLIACTIPLQYYHMHLVCLIDLNPIIMVNTSR